MRALALVLLVGCGTPAARPAPTEPDGEVGRLGMELGALFKDATGVTVGMPVRVADAIRGRVIRLEPTAEGTRVWLEVERNLEIWPMGRLRKRPNGLELWPGGPKHLWDHPARDGSFIVVDEP